MENNYWTGDWSSESVSLYAKFLNQEKNSNEFDPSMPIETLQDLILAEGNVGDYELRKLFENEIYLIVLSRDSNAGDFLNIVYKDDINKSETKELN